MKIKSVIELIQHLVVQVEVLLVHWGQAFLLGSFLLLIFDVGKLGLEFLSFREWVLGLCFKGCSEPQESTSFFGSFLDVFDQSCHHGSVIRPTEDQTQMLPDEILQPRAVKVGVSTILIEEFLEQSQKRRHFLIRNGGEGIPAGLVVSLPDDFLEERPILGGDGLFDDCAVRLCVGVEVRTGGNVGVGGGGGEGVVGVRWLQGLVDDQAVGFHAVVDSIIYYYALPPGDNNHGKTIWDRRFRRGNISIVSLIKLLLSFWSASR